MIGWHGQTLFVHAELANVFYKSQIVTLLSYISNILSTLPPRFILTYSSLWCFPLRLISSNHGKFEYRLAKPTLFFKFCNKIPIIRGKQVTILQ